MTPPSTASSPPALSLPELPLAPAPANPVTGEPGRPNPGAGIDYDKFLDCVHCGLCTAACPTYLETGNENDSPRGRIYLMRAVTDGRLELTDRVTRHLELCLDCRSCETACPSGVQYGRLIEPFRVNMQQGQAPGWFDRFILYGLFPYADRLRLALWPARLMQRLGLDRWVERSGLLRLLPEKLRRMQGLLPPLRDRQPALPEFLPAIGPRRARVALFTGCVADAMFRHVHWATARVLQQNGCDVVIPKSQGCCGAIHYHSGAGAPALHMAETNAEAFANGGSDASLDVDAVIVNVAGCGAMLKDYGHMAEELAPGRHDLHARLARFSGKVRDVSEFLVELGPIAPRGAVPLKATYHDACHLAHAQKVRSQPRQILEMIPGLTLVPLPESDICCGAAGSYNLSEGEMADRLGDRKVRNILSTGAEAAISGNAGCTLQLISTLRKNGAAVEVLHPMELLDRSYSS